MEKNPSCYEMKIFVQQMHKDLFSVLLPELGISDFILDAVDCDLEAEYNPNNSNQNRYEEFLLQAQSPIVVYSEDKNQLIFVQKELERILPSLHIPVTEDMFVITEIDGNWRDSWKDSFKPIFVKDVFAILPPWENPEKFTQKFKITIDPGMAFGTGQHETTRLCLEAMLNVPHLGRVLDVGTGSGILAIAARMLGSKNIIGTDLDPDCIPIALENAQANGISDIPFYHQPCDQITPDHSFNTIIANIQSTPLKTILGEIKRLAAPGAQIILSGILTSERDDFVSFAKALGFVFQSTIDLNDWCCLCFSV